MKNAPGAPVPESVSVAEPVSVRQPADWMFLQPAILDQMHDAVIATDLEGIVTGCNRAVQLIYGYTPDELTGQSIAILYPEDDRASFHTRVLADVHAQGEFRGEVRRRTRAGNDVYVHLSVTLLRDADNEPAGMVGFSVDVTARKLGELAIRRGDEVERQLVSAREETGIMRLLVSAVERAGDVFLITEAEPVELPGPRILYVNKAFEKMTGYSPEEVIGRTPRILQGPKTDRAALDRIRAALKLWKPVREEMINYRKDGTEFCVDLSIVPIANENGWYTHWMAIQRDVTEQTRLREEIAAGKSRLHFLTEAIPQLLWTASAEGFCDFVSQSFAHFLGVTTAECLGVGWLQHVHPEDRGNAASVWQQAIDSSQTCIVEYRLRRHDGEYIWFLHRAVPRLDAAGRILEWIGSSTDIEQQKRSEAAIRQTEKLAVVGRLASSIAHEINNPLGSVTNLLYLLGSQSSLDKTAREYVRSAQEELARVAEITIQTLRFHQQSTAPAPARVAEILDAVLAFFRPRLAAAGIQVRREYDRIPQLTCLAGDLRQVFVNLIGNAVDATPGGGRLRIRLRPSLSWKRRQRRGIRITFADTGHGIDERLLQRIFEPFYTTKGITGTGLGLWITKDLIARHDGILSLRSSTHPDRSGTVLSIFLPFEPRPTRP